MTWKNKLYIYKWLLVRRWFTVERWSTGEMFKTSKLKPGQLEGLLWVHSRLKRKKWYRLSDYIRDRLVEIGYKYLSPMDLPEINLGNLSGHIRKNLIYKNDGKEISLSGYIHTKKHSFESFDFNYQF